jgi:hypothetical protein
LGGGDKTQLADDFETVALDCAADTDFYSSRDESCDFGTDLGNEEDDDFLGLGKFF